MADEAFGTEGAGPTYLIHTFEHRAYPLSEERSFTIGRDVGCDIMVNEVSVSRHHAELRPEHGEFVLHATGSTPTVLNDLPLAVPQVLRDGDAFMIGTMRFVFTRRRLPVAMAIVQSTREEKQSSVDDRRQTLTFPAQGQAVPRQEGSKMWVWGVAIAVMIAVAFALSRLA